MNRDESWELSGFDFLVKANPKRYTLNKVSELDNMVSVFFLIDNINQSQMGRTIYMNNINKSFTSTIKTYKEISC